MEKEKLSKKELQAIETKKKIYETAERLFEKYGSDNVSVDSIVGMAGISKGGFYVHFDSKDSLITSLINDYVKKVDLNYKSYLDSLPPKTAVSDILISFVGKIADTLTDIIGYDNIKTLYKVQITKTINTDAVMSYNRELYKMFSDMLSEGIQRGEFRSDIAVDMLTKHCITALRGLTYEWCIRYPDFDLKEQSLMNFEILLNGIKKNNR